MRTIRSVIEVMDHVSRDAFESECVAWAEEAGSDAEAQLRSFLDEGGDRKQALSILSAISAVCEHELDIEMPEAVQEVLPNGAIRCSMPLENVPNFFPERFDKFEAIFRELRGR